MVVGNTAPAQLPGALGRDAGCGCCSAGTSLPPRVASGCELAQRGVIQGSCVPGPGAPQLAEVVLGVWDVQQLLEIPNLPCSTGAGGQQLLSPGVAALGCPCPSSSSAPGDPTLAVGKVFPQRVITGGWCNSGTSCWHRGKCACMFPGHDVAPGAGSYPFPNPWWQVPSHS